MTNPEPKPTYVPRVGDIVRVTRPPMDKEEWECFMDENWTYYHCDKGIVVETTPHCEMFGKVSVVRADRSGPDDMPHGVEACRLALVEAGRGPQVSLPSQPDDCGHHSETGLGGCGRFAWHCDGCGRIRWIYDASKGIGSRADVPRGVVLEGPPTTEVERAVAEEREACARACDHLQAIGPWHTADAAQRCAAAIRARAPKP